MLPKLGGVVFSRLGRGTSRLQPRGLATLRDCGQRQVSRKALEARCQLLVTPEGCFPPAPPPPPRTPEAQPAWLTCSGGGQTPSLDAPARGIREASTNPWGLRGVT